MTIYRNKDLEWKVVKPGTKRKVIVGKDLMLVLWNFGPNQVSSLHSHPHEQLTYVVEGEGEFQLGEEKTVLKRGDMVHIPVSIPHAFVSIGDKPLTIIDVFYPVREDLLPKKDKE